MTWETIGLPNLAELMILTSFGSTSCKTTEKIMEKSWDLSEMKELQSNFKFNSLKMWLPSINPWTSRNSPREPGPPPNWERTLACKTINGTPDAMMTENSQSWESASSWPLKETLPQTAWKESLRTVMRAIWCWANGRRKIRKEWLLWIPLTFDDYRNRLDNLFHEQSLRIL